MSDEAILLPIAGFMDAYKTELNGIHQRKGPELKPRRYYWEGYTISPKDREYYARDRQYFNETNKRDRLKAAGKTFDILAETVGLTALFKRQLGARPAVAE